MSGYILTLATNWLLTLAKREKRKEKRKKEKERKRKVKKKKNIILFIT